MNVRILKIAGAGSKSRENRLRLVEAWMKSHGWELMDYSDELGSAAFERIMASPRLRRIPLILETPVGDDGLGHVRDLELLPPGL